nr:hypothetical protein [Tanacetum cinerariifolium]
IHNDPKLFFGGGPGIAALELPLKEILVLMEETAIPGMNGSRKNDDVWLGFEAVKGILRGGWYGIKALVDRIKHKVILIRRWNRSPEV